ncbi:MAG: hypothetical protein DRG78_11650 [Epsilonproteobacteria bacterium]|nr:MAG: hypothetical protein DRG78_11650 [Campylobacterota bacterium]
MVIFIKDGGGGDSGSILPTIIGVVLMLLFFGDSMFLSIFDVLTESTENIGFFSGFFALFSGAIIFPLLFIIILGILDMNPKDDTISWWTSLLVLYIFRCIYVMFT